MRYVLSYRRLRALSAATTLLLALGLAGLVAGFAHEAGATGTSSPGCTAGVGDSAALVAAVKRAALSSQADTITLQAGCTYTLTAPVDGTDGPNGLTSLSKYSGPLTVVGNGATIARAAETVRFRIFHVAPGGSLALRQLTLRGGHAYTAYVSTYKGHGGAILSRGTLALEGVTAADNQAVWEGGAIFAGSSVTISASTFSGNRAEHEGGALYATSGTWSIVNTTISGNHAVDGGGLALEPWFSGSVTLNNSTVAGNSAGHGAANIAGGSGLRLSNTLVAEPGGGGSYRYGTPSGGTPNCSGAIQNDGGNLQHPGTSCGAFASADPLLGPLQNNGGPVATRLPGAGSPAIDAGVAEHCAAVDARGTARPQGAGCDIGAVETAAVFSGPLVVTTSDDDALPCSAEHCSLRAAILAANSIPTGEGGAADTISFAIPGDGPHVIRPTSALPEITGPVFIDGTSQPGSRANSLAAGDDAAIMIAIDGSLAGPASGLVLNGAGSSGSTVRGLAIGGFTDPSGQKGAGIELAGGSSGNTVAGVFLGTDAAGTGALPNRVGLLVRQGSATLGGAAPADRAIIAGNLAEGVLLQAGAGGSAVLGSYIGTLPDASKPLPNGGHGVLVDGAAGVQIGGTGPGEANLIAGNGGDGLRVVGGAAQATARGNGIFANGGLGIDLAGDGVTADDPGDGDAGPNTLQNAPTIDSATEGLGGTTITGRLNGAPGATATVDLYATPACDASGRGEGLVHLGVGSATADSAGAATFSITLSRAGLAGAWITAAASGGGGTSELSACVPIATNDLWTNALPLGLQPNGAAQTVTGSAGQLINRAYQERWYVFPVKPGSTVRVRLTSLPGSTVTLHRDIQKVYDELSLPLSEAKTAASDLPGSFLPGSFLPGSFLPGSFLPGSFLPGSFLPGSFLPGSFLPGSFLPGSFLPGSFLPGSFLPGSFLPGSFLPGSFLPGSFLPGSFLPGSFLPGSFLPQGVTPEQYAGAAYRSLMAVSADPAATDQAIERNTWDLSENMYVRVTGPANLATGFTIEATVVAGICETIAPVPGGLATIAGAQPAAGSFTTLIVWDSARFAAEDPAGDVGAVRARLAQFAQRADINGAVVDLAASEGGAPKYPRVAWANAQADGLPACSAAKNTVAREIRDVINAYRAANRAGAETSLRYLVLAGGDGVVPNFRLPDTAGLGSENEYFPPVKDNSATNAGLRENRVLGPDGYGATSEIWRGSYFLPVPDIAVGRLVGGAAGVLKVLTAYESAGGVVRPGSALVTGYDFVADAATQVSTDLAAGLNQPGCTAGCVQPRELIQPQGELPSAPSAWSAQALRAELLQKRYDLVFFNGHFDAGALLAADYTSGLSASELAGSPVDYSNALVFGLGCHSGFNIPGQDSLAFVSPEPDWSEAFAQRGATFVAATGYAYGDTELTDFGERLMLNLTRQLRTGSGPVAVGAALLEAKQEYLQQKSSLSGMDEKTLAQFALYGLPMLKVDMPGQRVAHATPADAVGAAAAVPGGPGQALGLLVGQPLSGAPANPSAAEITVAPALSRVDVPLTVRDPNTGASVGTVTTTYFSGPGGETATNPTEPVLPQARYDAGVPGTVLRGVGFRGGRYTDVGGVVPHTSAPSTESERPIGAFSAPTFYPTQSWSANQLGGLTGGTAQLVALPAQYRSSAPFAQDGTLRTYGEMRFRLYYLPAGWSSGSPALRGAGLAPALQIGQVRVQRVAAGQFEILVDVVGSGAAGVQEVWITYTDPAAPGRWESIDLQPVAGAPTQWRTAGASVALPETAVFMVQAASGAGMVGLDTNGGSYYPVVPPPPAAAQEPTALSGASIPTTGAFGDTVVFAARLERLAASGESVAGRQVTVALGSQLAVGTTAADGSVSVQLRLAQPPGEYGGRLAFGGAPGLAPTAVPFRFTITKAGTVLGIAPAASQANLNQPNSVVATLLDSAGRPIADRTVAFVASGAGSFARAVKTGIDGRAVLGTVPWPAGTYTIQAYFGGTVPLPGGAQTFSDVFYLAAQSQPVSLTIKDVRPPVTTASVSGTQVPGCPADCFVGSATVTLRADQPDAVIRYRVGGTVAWAVYVAPFTVRAAGVNVVEFYATSAGGVAEAVKRIEVKIAEAPTAPVADSFNRSNGGLGSGWSGDDKKGYAIVSNEVDVGRGGVMYWNPRRPEFNPTQEVFLRLTRIDPASRQHGVLLKVQRGVWHNGAILVAYDAVARQVVVKALKPHLGWITVATYSAPMANGDLLGARAMSDGTVRVYVNCSLVGVADTRPRLGRLYVGSGGRVGVWFADAAGATFDDFRAGGQEGSHH